MDKILRTVALVLLFFLGITGLWGGYELMNDPSGESLKMPMELLENTPFDDYLIPGILLFFGNGALSLLIAVLTIKKVRYHPYLIVFQGTILLVWLTTELIINIDFFFPQTHITYYLVSILLIVVGLRLHRSENKPERTDN
ncbi:hypothetical protein [Flagellimonas lutaonensis]|uniref:Uncharacterized protein n=1 Tax=Flagellimonas lutaonensis TaxID=516051 RepID=A0A0D5YQW6_9FLAO|nr:hypothetical protein [Allomuricauda lutaonensis]AKA34283.1 hypothetical protein VC82_613 [Allomuricauda lutaonensis]